MNDYGYVARKPVTSNATADGKNELCDIDDCTQPARHVTQPWSVFSCTKHIPEAQDASRVWEAESIEAAIERQKAIDSIRRTGG